MDFGDDQERGSETNHNAQQQQERRKRYHHYTPRQIQALEASFKECPYPDETERGKLGRDLGLEARKIKFSFQNRRTQMKVQQKRQDNCFLRVENDDIRCQNIALRGALKNVICPNYSPPVAKDYFDKQKLHMENARLKEELDGLTSKSIGGPFAQMPHGTPQISVSPLDLSMGDVPFGDTGLSLDLDLSGSEGCGKQDWGAQFSTSN